MRESYKKRAKTSKLAAARSAPAQITRSLAKITAPTARRALHREALFKLFDDYSERRLVWLSAPAGYGKTTAVITYLRLGKIPSAWYQCDDGDSDIASFFYHLSLAFRPLTSKAPSSTPFSPEHFAAVPAFARRFCRAWFSLLPPGAAIVLDNWQDLPYDSALRDLLPLIIEEIPEGIRLFVISRTAPAANLSRLLTDERIALVDAHELRLSKEETAAIAAMYARPAGQKSVMTTDELYSLTHGWAAGLAVLLRHENDATFRHSNARSDTLQATFNFLSTEVFDRLSTEVRDLLVKTACLDQVSVTVARQIVGDFHVREHLDDLVAHNAFTTYRAPSDTYHYHPLFREFLLSRMTATLSATEQRELRIAAAHALADVHDGEQAIHLLLQAGDWEQAAELIAAGAPAVVQQARFQTLSAWMDKLPESTRSKHAWIAYWRGIVQMVLDFPAARSSLDRAYALFTQTGDAFGRMLAAAAILQHISYCYIEFGSTVPWIEILVDLLNDRPAFPSASVELQVMTGLLLALAQARPTHPALSGCVVRVTSLIDSDVDLASSAAGVAALLQFYGMCGRTASYRALDGRVDSLLKAPELGPSARIHLLWMEGYQRFLRGFGNEAYGLLDVAGAIAREHGLSAFELRVNVSRLQNKEFHLHAGELAADFAALEPALTRVPPMVVAHARYLQAMSLLAGGELVRARQIIGECARSFIGSGWVVASVMMAIGQAQVEVELQQCAEAERLLTEAEESIDGLDAPVLRFNSALVRAEIARRTCPAPEFAAALARAFAIGREQQFACEFHAFGLTLPRLIPYALGLGIEVGYCRWVIQRRSLVPPPADIPHWPWPVRIKAMGQLDVFVDDVPLEYTGKAQRKPIDLLKLLITRSAGVDIVRVMDTLWRDLDGDAARNAFDLAVHRLRKLLKHKDAVLLNKGRLLLNPQLVWVDAFILERLSVEGFAESHLPRSVDSLLTLYRAPLLSDDEGSEVFSAQKRLRSQFIRSVAALAEQLTKTGSWEVVARLCRQAIEIEPLEEGLYRTWIRTLLAQGHHAEAEAVYRSCEQTLARLLHSKPSRTTSSLLFPPPSR